MRADVRSNGMLRPDLLQALRELEARLHPLAGGIVRFHISMEGRHRSRTWPENIIRMKFGEAIRIITALGRRNSWNFAGGWNTEPLVVLAATNTDPAQVQYEMDWVHYLNDPPTTTWGKMRSANGHPEPYNVRYFQIDNEPMNHGFSPEQYAEIVNVYGSNLRRIAPHARIVACGQKRSTDMEWSEKLVDIAGDNFDILGCHNYEYENENFQTGLRRIRDYLVKLRDYIRASRHPEIKMAVLEWSLCRSYDWRAGLHTAGSLILYEELSPELAMSCPALLMRNTTDDPDVARFIYHDHVSWFPGSGYVVEKLFREHYAENYFASSTGTFRDIPNRSAFFDDISQMKPEGWKPGTLDAIATGSADGKRIVIKAVNYAGAQDHVVGALARFQGSGNARVKTYS